MVATVQPDGEEHQRQVARILEQLGRGSAALEALPGFGQLQQLVEAPWSHENMATDAAPSSIPDCHSRLMMELGWECDPLPLGIEARQRRLWLTRKGDWLITLTSEQLDASKSPRIWRTWLRNWQLELVAASDLHLWIPKGEASLLAQACSLVFRRGVTQREAQLDPWREAGEAFSALQVEFGRSDNS